MSSQPPRGEPTSLVPGSRDQELDAALATLDARIEALGLTIWVGSEPTFTDASSLDAEWNAAALGPTKEARARRLLAHYAKPREASIIARCVGRQYTGDKKPRWTYGLWCRRDKRAVWRGPRDPMLVELPESTISDPVAVRDAIAARLAAVGCGVAMFETDDDFRVAAREDGTMPDPEDERLLDASPHEVPTPESGLVDDLARESNTWLFRLSSEKDDGGGEVVRLELPELLDVATFERVLGWIEEAVAPLHLPALVLAGHPPPIDASVSYASVSPDPAVIEVNMAPHASARSFAEDWRAWHAAAEAQGLAARRFFYNGEVGDSGGGGQITIGGPRVDASPFFLEPALLPRLVAYTNRHPSLSYLFAVDNVGPWSQAPRADEGPTALVRELQLSLVRVSRARRSELDRVRIQGSLGPFLRDSTGNAHRAEINIEKLWNDALPQRGKLGLVELRALRMAATPARAASLCALVRAIVARLSSAEAPMTMVDWGEALHDRFALPHCLAGDLEEVFSDLRDHKLGLGPVVEDELRDHRERRAGAVSLGSASLEISKAIDIWPLVGDAGSQEQSTSRWIDASSRRLELLLEDSPDRIESHRITIDGVLVPLHRDPKDPASPVRLAAIRYRAYVPKHGLHPDLPAQSVVELKWWREGDEEGRTIALHGWKPDDSAYEGLPATDEEASQRRQDRVAVTPISTAGLEAEQPPEGAARGFTLDRRAW